MGTIPWVVVVGPRTATVIGDWLMRFDKDGKRSAIRGDYMKAVFVYRDEFSSVCQMDWMESIVHRRYVRLV